MFFSSCVRRVVLAFSLMYALTSTISAHAATPHPITPAMGKVAEKHIRHIATYFPGRMAGNPSERIAAEYINQYFTHLGYQSNLRSFVARYLFTSNNSKQTWTQVNATSVIAARAGQEPQEILVVAHIDTYTPTSDEDINNNLGGLSLQGVDDNASGVGVLMELAEKMSHIPTRYGIRFIVLSGEEIGDQGSKNYLARMTEQEKQNTLLVIGLNGLLTGDKLYFSSGLHTSEAMVKKSRDRALAIARKNNIPATSDPSLKKFSSQENKCCSHPELFDQAKLPVLTIEATSAKPSAYFPQGISWHQSQRDNLQYIDAHLPGRIALRSKESVRILLPLLKELAQPATRSPNSKR